MDRKKIVKWICIWGLASVTTLALAMDFAITPVTQIAGSTAGMKIYYQLLALKKSITWSHPALCLAAAALMKLYGKAFNNMRFQMSELMMAAFFAIAMLVTTAMGTAQTVRVLWGSALQPVKVCLYLMGMTAMWLALIRGAAMAMQHLENKATVRMKHPMRTPFLLMLAAWLPLVIVRFPGGSIDDTLYQITEFYGTAPEPDTNPAAHTFLIGSLMKVGEWLNMPMLGMYLNTLLQVAGLLLCLAWGTYLLQQADAPAPFVWASVGIPIVSPLFVSYASFVLKDTACAIFVLLFVIQTGLLLARPDLFWSRRRHLVLWYAGMAGAVLMRTNGLLFVLPTAAILLLKMIFGREKRTLPVLLITAVVLVGTFTLQNAANERMKYGHGNIREIFCIPFQQTARVLKDHSDVPQHEIDIIDQVLDAEAIPELYDYYYADDVKRTFRNEEVSTQELVDYFGVWAKQLVRYPVTYFDALAGMCHRVFSPVVLDVDLTMVGYAEVIGPGWDVNEWYASQPLLVLDKVITGIQQMISALPFAGVLCSLGAHTCMVIISGWYMLHRRRRLWPLWTVPLMNVIMLIFAPITMTRYALPLFFMMPVLMGWLSVPNQPAKEMNPEETHDATKSAAPAGHVPAGQPDHAGAGR